MNQIKQKAFTLVELIVVITILAILGTIAFISLQGYSRDARDSVRQSDVANINSSLTLFETEKGIYPEPTGGVDITFSGGQVWNQGTIGSSVITNLAQLNGKPIDPLTGVEYTYSRLNTKKEFEIATVMEGGVAKNTNIISQANAAGTLLGTAYVKGDYNGMIAKVSTGGTTYVLAIPTIISGDRSLTDIIELMQLGSLVYNGTNNLPDSYKGTTFNVNGGGFTFNPNTIVAYTGTTDSLINTDNQIILIDNFKTIYTGTDAINNEQINEVVNILINTGSLSEEVKLLASLVVKYNINPSVLEYDPTIPDNCPSHYNPDQIDSNNDGYGNICDADLDNNGVVNELDSAIFQSVFFTDDADADFNSDGIVNVLDLGIFKSFSGTTMP